MAKPFDATLNSLLDTFPVDWANYLAQRVGIPLGPVTTLDTDLASTLQPDHLFQVAGAEPTVLHLELESSGRLGIPEELLRYNIAAWGQTQLPVRSIVMLLRPKATATDLTGLLELRVHGRTYLTFQYDVIRVWEQPLAEMLNAGLGLAPLALLTNEAAADLPTGFQRLETRLQAPDVSATMRETVLGSTYVLGGLRYPKERLKELYMKLDQILEDSTTYQDLLRRGGIQHLQNTVLKLGPKRLGPITPEREAQIKAVDELDRLVLMIERIPMVTSWDELVTP